MKPGIGIIGCGGRLQGVIQPRSDAPVVAICDPDPESVAAARKLYGTDFKVFATAAELCADPGVTWVAVGSWNSLHREHAVTALRAGKHVFCEKPLAPTLADCLAIRDAVQAAPHQMFSFGLVLRYSALYRKVSDLLQAGAIGRLISFEFNETLNFNHGGYIMGNWRRFRRNAGTHLLEKCCHDLDLARWFVGALPVRVASFGGLNFYTPENQRHIQRLGKDPKGRAAYQTWPTADRTNPFTAEKDIVDNQVVILEYANGVRATFHTNCNAGVSERRFYLLGSEGAIRADACTGIVELHPIGFGAQPEITDTKASGGHAGGDEILRASLFDSIIRGTPPQVGITEALQSAITGFGIDQAIDTGQVVDLRPLWQQAGLTP